jgi:tetratricopeptide (TPR) repeat protein
MTGSTGELEAAFERDPLDVRAFAALRRAYEKEGDAQKVSALLSRRAAKLPDGEQAAALLCEAAELLLKSGGEPTRASDLLRRAVARDATFARATEQLKNLFKSASRFTDYADVLERELDALTERRADPRQLAALHLELGEIYEQHFARLDRAMEHYQSGFKLDPSLVSAIESGRRIYRSLGDWPMVARLYELELDVAEPARRVDLLVALGRVQAERLGQYGPGTERLQEAARQRPGDEKILEALGGLLAHPDFPDETGLDRAAHVFLDLGRQKLSAGEGEAASAYLRRALGADPDNEEAARLLEETYIALDRWADLDRLYRQRLATATGPDAVELLMRRAHLSEERLADRAEAKRCYEAILSFEPLGGPASARLAALYAEDSDWEALARLKLSVLERTVDPAARIPLRLELGALYTDRLGDPDSGAGMWMSVLEEDPLNQHAYEAYAEYLKKRHDWRALADLHEFSLEAMQAAGLPAPAQIARLEEVAELSEKRLGDVERAVAAWKRIDELEGGRHEGRTRDALKRLLAKAKMWEGLVAVLEKEAREAASPQTRAEVLKRMAQVYREKQVDPRRAIQLYEEALRTTPNDAAALRALADLYERENDWQGHAGSLRRLLGMAQTKIERLNLLRKLAVIYSDKLGDVEEATWACTEILEAVPGDRDALGRLEDLLEEAGRWPRLMKTLEYHAETAATPAEKVKILKRMARLAKGQLADEVEATTRWEAVRKLSPDDPEATNALAELYERIERWQDLQNLLDRRLHRLDPKSPEHLELLRRLGRIAARTAEPLRALKAWRKIAELSGQDREALTHLAELLRGQGSAAERTELGAVLGRLQALEPDPARAAELALERATLLAGAGQPAAAAQALETLLADLDPRNLAAHALLRRIYEQTGEWARALRVAERELLLVEDEAERVARGAEIAALWKTRLSDGRRAAQAWERVLDLAPGHEHAQAELAQLYLELGERTRYLELQERRIEQTPDPDLRHALLSATAEAAEQPLGEADLAFEWRQRAYLDRPGPEELAALVGVAERHGLWESMIRFYDSARSQAEAPAPPVEAARKIAEICERKLEDPRRALAVLRDALPADPEGRALLGEIERLADMCADPAALLDVYARVGRARRDPQEKIELLRLRAAVREGRQDDSSGAMDEHLLAFQLLPDDETTRAELVRLAERTSRWEDLLRTEAKRFGLASDAVGRLAIARRAAAIVEEKLGDRVRAFRAYLNAFRLAPDDAEIVGHLWRLAGEIGEYHKSSGNGAAPHAEPDQAHAGPGWGREATLEVQISDLEILEAEPDPEPATGREGAAGAASTEVAPEAAGRDAEGGAGAAPAPVDNAAAGDHHAAEVSGRAPGGAAPAGVETRDPTLELDGAMLRALAVRPERDPTMELKTRDLSAVVLEARRRKGPPPAPPPRAGRPPVPRGLVPPPPPSAALAAGGPRSATPAVPQVLASSAWEELALAYEALPQDGEEMKITRLLQIADVWERGAKDLDRAFIVLEKAFRIDPDAANVREAMDRMGGGHDAWDRVSAIFLRMADELGSAARNLRLHLDVARIRETEGRLDLAERQYDAVLAIDPSHEAALSRLEELYRRAERFGELAEMLERRTSGLLERLPPGPRRIGALRELAEIYQTRLSKPYEAVDAAGRLAHEDPQNPDVYALLARLYEQVGLWAKVIESLGREADLSDRARAREARRRIAEIYEQQLELPDRAVEAYRALLELDPNDDPALAAVDRLLEGLGRWKELDPVLRRRAARVEGEARIELARRRAQLAEEKLGDPDAAANAYKELRSLSRGDDPQLTERLLLALRRAGRAREAATLLNERVAQLESAGAPPLEVAAALVELGVLRAGPLEDEAGARKTLERALKVSPGYPPALAEVARLHLGGADYRGYAQAREREAEVQTDPARAALALIDAASVYRDRLEDREHAKVCLGRAYELDPHSRAALSGLLALAEEDQRWDVAYALGRKRLELAEDATERADLLVAVARAAQKTAGGAAEARALLESAVNAAPEHVGGALGLADLEFAEGHYHEAEQLLERALDRVAGDPEAAARLHYRLGECYDRLGKLDEGYRALLEADKQSPGQLMLRLALGENRFRARRWREAALHLGAVGEHKDAARYPEVVAIGLTHAAEAEIKMRRPERAPGLYDSALRANPGCLEALHALGELAARAGDRMGAAGYQEREGAARGDAALLERAGDAWMELDDATSARRAYERALVALAADAPPAIGLCEKLLPLQRDAGDLDAAQRTADLLVTATIDAVQRAARRRVAAALAHARGDVPGAIAHWTRALEDDPADEVALLALGDVGDPKDAVALYTRVINHLPEPRLDEASLTRRAALWEKLGLLRIEITRDTRGAAAALEKAVEIDPNRRRAREALADLYGESPEHAAAAVANHRALLSLDILRVPSLQAIAKLYAAAGSEVKARLVYQVLELVSGLSAEERAWLESHPDTLLEPDDAYPGTLDETDRARVALVQARALAEVFAALYEGAPTLYGRSFESYGVTPQDRVSPVSTLLAARIFGQVSRALGNRKTGLYLKRDRGLDGIALLSHPPTGVLIGPRIAEETPIGELRFQLGRAVELTRPDYVLAATADTKEFAKLFSAVLRAYHPRHARRRPQPGDASEMAARLKKLLPYTASKRLAELFARQQSTSWSSADWRQAVRLSASRVGLLVCGDLRAAMRVLVRENEPDLPDEPPPAELARLVGRSTPLRDLLTFALSEEYFAARAKLLGR